MMRIALGLFAAATAMAQPGSAPTLVQPVGIVLEGTPPCEPPSCKKEGVLLRTAKQGVPLQALPGVPLFPGDTLENIDGSVVFVLCSDRKKRTLAPKDKATIGEGTVTGGTETAEAVEFCLLPAIDREPVAGGPRFDSTPPVPPPNETEEDRLRALPPVERAEFLRLSSPPQEALQRNAEDMMAAIEVAVLFERFQLRYEAWDEYSAIGERWPAAVWARGKAQEVRPPNSSPDQAGPGKTYAVVLGVSDFELAPKLQFAATDAVTMGDFLGRARGGGLRNPERDRDDLVVITDKDATPSAVRAALDAVFAKAKSQDTVVIFVASHGVVAGGEGFILTTHSNPADLKTSALTMAEIRGTVFKHLEKTRRVLLYLDVCRAGKIGVIPGPNAITNESYLTLKVDSRKLGALLASSPWEVAFEAKEYGDGHGAFTYFLLRGLNGDADTNHDKEVSSQELLDYVKTMVSKATHGTQHPSDVVVLEPREPLSRTDVSPGIEMKDWTLPPAARFRGSRYILTSAQRLGVRGAPDESPEPADDLELQFDKALQAGRLRADEPESASAVLERLRRDTNPLTRQRIRMFESRLLVALENRGERVVLKYLHGDQEPGTAEEFLEGARDFEAALRLAPAAQFDESRGLFCRGRAAIYAKQYALAVQLLEQAIRLDPTRAYSYNALGIAYLEQVPQNVRYYEYAAAAFQDAIRRAPYWTYPRHNLALALTQRGEVQRAAVEYRAAMDLGPDYSYLPYNLGMLYQQIADFPEAKNYYQQAVKVAERRCEGRLGKGFTACPERSLPETGLASLEIQKGNRRKARNLLNAALKDDALDLTAAHDKAALLADWRGHEREAETLWQDNLKRQPAHLPTLIGYSSLLSRECRFGEAIPLYRRIVKEIPGYVPAQIGLARALVANGDVTEGGSRTEALVRQRQGSAQAWAARAEYLSRSGAPAEEAWDQALQLAKDGSERKQLVNRRKGTGCLKRP